VIESSPAYGKINVNQQIVGPFSVPLPSSFIIFFLSIGLILLCFSSMELDSWHGAVRCPLPPALEVTHAARLFLIGDALTAALTTALIGAWACAWASAWGDETIPQNRK